MTMKLGIVVVYLVREGNERLIDLHLESIRRNTSVSYTIYGCATRLVRALRERLAGDPAVTLVDLPATGLRKKRGARELPGAVDTGRDRGGRDARRRSSRGLVPDPKRLVRGPGERYSAPARPFAAAVRESRLDFKPFTAGMLITREFLLERRPRFLLDAAERASADYRRYRRRFRHHHDSGVGYGFFAFREGVEWFPLERTNRGEDHCHFGSIYGDTFFHLGAAAWKRKDFPGSRAPTGALEVRARLSSRLSRFVPERVRIGIKRAVNRTVPALDIGRKYAANEREFEIVRARLFSDPDSYVNYLRFG